MPERTLTPTLDRESVKPVQQSRSATYAAGNQTLFIPD